MSESSGDELCSNLQQVVVTHLKKRGTREEVWNGHAASTSGGLTRSDLMISNGKLVSKKASEKSKQLMLDRHQAKKDLLVANEPAASVLEKPSKTSKKTNNGDLKTVNNDLQEKLPKNKTAPSTVKLIKPSKKKVLPPPPPPSEDEDEYSEEDE